MPVSYTHLDVYKRQGNMKPKYGKYHYWLSLNVTGPFNADFVALVITYNVCYSIDSTIHLLPLSRFLCARTYCFINTCVCVLLLELNYNKILLILE